MRFSARTPRAMGRNAIARALAARRRPYLDLTQTNPTRCGLSPSDEELHEALAVAGVSLYEPDPRGMPSARGVLAEHLARGGAAVPPERLVLTSSTSEAYALLFKLLCDPGDAVLVPEPSYPLFDHLAEMEAVRCAAYRLRFSGRWDVDVAEVGAGLSAGARAVLAVAPNNPTGSFLSKEEMSALAEGSARHGVALVCDEVFRDYPMEPPEDRAGPASAFPSGALTFSLGGLSKSCALPQMKLAWIAVTGPDAAVEEALARLDLIADTYLSVATPVQRALPGLLAAGEAAAARVRARIAGNLARLDAELSRAGAAGRGVGRLPVEGGWSCLLRSPGLGDEEQTVLALLSEHDVLVQPGWFFNIALPGVLVLSLLPEEEEFAEGCRRLLAGL